MVRKGEKMYSFVKYEKELESDYRRKLDEVKRPDEVGGVFVEFAFKLLRKVKEDIPDEAREWIKFKPEGDVPYTLDGRIEEILGDIMKKSDLPAIIERMAMAAHHRYKKLRSDDERTDLFRMGESAKPH